MHLAIFGNLETESVCRTNSQMTALQKREHVYYKSQHSTWYPTGVPGTVTVPVRVCDHPGFFFSCAHDRIENPVYGAFITVRGMPQVDQ